MCVVVVVENVVKSVDRKGARIMYAHAKVSVFDNAEKLSLMDQKFDEKP